jgi:hypothetical protein
LDRFVLVARLQPGGRERAQELLTEHSALGMEELETHLDRHTIFLTETEVIFVFEGEGAPEAVRAIFNDPVRSTVVGRWLPLFAGPLHQALQAYAWERDGDGTRP